MAVDESKLVECLLERNDGPPEPEQSNPKAEEAGWDDDLDFELDNDDHFGIDSKPEPKSSDLTDRLWLSTEKKDYS